MLFLFCTLLFPSTSRSRIVVKDLEGNFVKVLLPEIILCMLLNVSELTRD